MTHKIYSYNDSYPAQQVLFHWWPIEDRLRGLKCLSGPTHRTNWLLEHVQVHIHHHELERNVAEIFDK